MLRHLCGLILIMSLGTLSAVAQRPREVVMQPVLAGKSRTVTLSDLVLAKIDQGDTGTQVIFMLESYRDEQRTVKVTRLLEEQRTREIEVDGKPVTQTYVVRVPVIEEREITVSSPAGRKPRSVDAKTVRFFGLDGKPVPIDTAVDRLSSLRPVFLIDQHAAFPQPLPEIAQRALREDCLIAVTADRVRPQRAGVPPPVAIPAP